MGCGSSSPSHNNNNTAGRSEFPSKLSDESLPEDDKHGNYGGVYVGLPSDLSSVPQVHIGSLRDVDSDPVSLMTPLWGDELSP